MQLNFNSFIPHLLLFVVALLLIELAFHLFWNKKYFNFGLKVFKYHIKAIEIEAFDSQTLNEFFHKKNFFFLLPSFVFSNLTSNKLAFREKYYWPSIYLPIMRGLVIYEPFNKRIMIYGLLNYFPIISLIIVFPLIFYNAFRDSQSYIFFLLFYFVSFAIQWVRFLILGINIIKTLKKGHVTEEKRGRH